MTFDNDYVFYFFFRDNEFGEGALSNFYEPDQARFVKVNKGAVVNSRQVLLILATANDAKGRQAIMGTILVGASLFIADNVEWLICSAIRSVLVW